MADTPPTIPVEALEKAVNQLNTFAQGASQPTRKDALLAKAMKNETTPDEDKELAGLLSGVSVGTTPEPFAKSATAPVATPEATSPSAQAFRANEFLADWNDRVVKSLGLVAAKIDSLSQAIEANAARSTETAVMMAKAIVASANVTRGGTDLVKSLKDDVEKLLAMPVGQPRGVVSTGQGPQVMPTVLEKSFGGQAPAGFGGQIPAQAQAAMAAAQQPGPGLLSRGDVLKTFEFMAKSNVYSVGGSPLALVASAYEGDGVLTEQAAQDIISFRKEHMK